MILLNTTTKISLTVQTRIQILIATNNLNDTSNFTQKTILKIEAQLPLLKNYIDCKFSTFISKIDAFLDLFKKALANLQKRECNYSDTELLQQNIIFLENKINSKDKIIQSLQQAEDPATTSLSNLNTKDPSQQ